MKKALLIFLSLLMILSTVFVSCGPKDPGDDLGAVVNEDGTYSVFSPYLPTALSDSLKTMLADSNDSSFETATMKNAPFVMVDNLQISDCKISSISIPIYSTLEPEDGVFTFTLSVVRADTLNNLKETLDLPLKKYPISIDADKFELEENQIVRKYIKVDLKEYDIKLTNTQTLAFGAPDDTIIPAIIRTDKAKTDQTPAAKRFIDDWGVVSYYYFSGSGNAFSVAHSSLCYDVVMEHIYESQEAYEALIAAQNQADADYQAKLAAVKAAYEGKSISMMGDSISTCEGVTNGTSYNSTIGSNAVYGQHKPTAPAYHYSKIYWGKLATETGMQLNVMNAWSGGRVYGREDLSYADNMLKRSYHLANNDGLNPNLILLYYAINDINNSPSSIYSAGHNLSSFSYTDPTSNLYQQLQNKGTQTTTEVVAAWFTEVQAKAAAAGYVRTDENPVITPGVTYTSWEAAYALSLYNILHSYNNPEVYIMTLVETNHSSAADGKLDRANTILRAFAEYFGTGLIDQQKGYVTKKNCHLYTYDTDSSLHPNIKGHALIEKLIVETLYNDLNK
ncbi:MAG: hypothetical protein E7585_05425 [Ruminococcaceae bacterium]|nr:hypothetical protein [Oscillospiraceae bacterium]